MLCRCVDVRGKKAARIKQSACCVDPQYSSSAHEPQAHAYTYQPFTHHLSASVSVKTSHQRTQDGKLLMKMLCCVLTGGWPNTTYLFHESSPVFDLAQFNSCIGQGNITDEAQFFWGGSWHEHQGKDCLQHLLAKHQADTYTGQNRSRNDEHYVSYIVTENIEQQEHPSLGACERACCSCDLSLCEPCRGQSRAED